MILSMPWLMFRLSPFRRALSVVALLCVFVVHAVGARADSPSTLTVVGTSDVQDSGLMPQLVIPMFEKAFPQYTLRYVSVGTGVAINDAETGVASALLVHAASLENQFVAQGFSNEPLGRAIVYGDYVLLGPASDPAGVLSDAPHDVAAAFARIAAAGAAGKADLVSRGGTPGTTVEEHAIWALDAGTSGLTLCTVSAANGGGMAPSTAAGSCPATTSNPSWYHTTGLTQGPNIETANTCNFPNANGGNDCYAITDRGTFDCLMSVSCAGGSAAPTNLRIVARQNDAAAKGGETLLINSFHAYAINPKKFAGNANVQINVTAAEDFLNFITSASLQAQLKTFLAATNDPPFIADAAPSVSARFPTTATADKHVTVSGKVANLVPGTPPLAGKTLTVTESGVFIASGKTDSSGSYRITFRPPSTGDYQVSTGQITQIEDASLDPEFGDLLQPGASTASRITVHGAVSDLSVKALPGRVLAIGVVEPGGGHVKGLVDLLARRGKRGAFKRIASDRLASGDERFALSAGVPPGGWYVKVRFQDRGQIVAATSRQKKLSVMARAAARVSVRFVRVKAGRLTVAGSVAPAPGVSGAIVQVLGLDAGALTSAKKTAAVAGARARFRVVGTALVRTGARTFTAHGRLARGQHWIIMVKYTSGGASGSAFGSLKAVRVT